MNEDTTLSQPADTHDQDAAGVVAEAMAKQARTEATATRPRTFREYWSDCLRRSSYLRRLRDHEEVTLERGHFREALKDAFDSGADSTRETPPSQ